MYTVAQPAFDLMEEYKAKIKEFYSNEKEEVFEILKK